MAKLSNPLAFTRGPVTVLTTLIYVAVFTILILIQTGPPTPPSNAVPVNGINLTEAWNDLQTLSAEFHPFNSRRNDVTRKWLLSRIDEIIQSNNASSEDVYVFDDTTSNLTFTSSGNAASVYFESLNIVVYIRGEADDPNEWWNTTDGKPRESNAVLVNAHFDSVSTGFGATDDGVGVVSILQLLRLYTTSGNTPEHGLVLLLNDGEEDYLNGAYVFSQNPMANIVGSFLNLEGAGAGGRATLFRSTDEEVTKAYASSPYPYGTVISGDAFSAGLIRSQTDYVVFNGKLGMRGLDVAFFEPRSQYHTDQDDSRHTGKGAIWHMLSAAIATTQQLTKSGLTMDETSNQGMWFDLFGRAMVCIQTHTFFALAITLLVVGPILLFATLGVLYKADKQYMWSGSRKYHGMDAEETISINGWRGFFRFPLLLIFSCAGPVALAYLMFLVNPYIAHSSEWAVWAMMISAFFFVAWFFARSFDYARPSALTRAYGLGWLSVIWWAILVGGVVFEEQFHLAGGYFTLFYFACVLIATFLSYLELASLPKKSKYCVDKLGGSYPASRISRSRSVSRPVSRSSRHREPEEEPEDANADEDVTERSSLLRNRGRSAFKNYSGRATDEDVASISSKLKVKTPHYYEQEWSNSMWTWIWVFQFIILVPFNLILLGQLALYMVSALHQTGQDGSSMFTLYILMAIMTILLFMPMLPLMHRFTYHIPVFLLAVLLGTILYNCLAFPFSSQNRLKLFFQQEVDLTTGANNVSLKGIDPYVQAAIAEIPSADGQQINCTDVSGLTNVKKCVWSGVLPNVVDTETSTSSNSSQMSSWVEYTAATVHVGESSKTAQFSVLGKNTRGCKITFNTTISDFYVEGQGSIDKRISVVNDNETNEIRLWHREWSQPWTLNVTWKYDTNTDTGISGKVACIWSDANQPEAIPALDEVRHYVPDWVAITKAADGLVEGFKHFEVTKDVPKEEPAPIEPPKPEPSSSTSTKTQSTASSTTSIVRPTPPRFTPPPPPPPKTTTPVAPPPEKPEPSETTPAETKPPKTDPPPKNDKPIATEPPEDTKPSSSMSISTPVRPPPPPKMTPPSKGGDPPKDELRKER